MSDIPAWARGYIGTPFRNLGRTKAGADCWGLYRLIVGDRASVWFPKFSTLYSDVTDGDAIAEAVAVNGTKSPEWKEVPTGDERLFDAVLMTGVYPVELDGQTEWRKADIHIGCVLVPGVLIHIEQGINAALGYYREDPMFV